MAAINLTKFEQYAASYIPFVSNALDYKRESQIQKALVQLYDETDGVTVLLVKFIIAVVWWGSHIGSAAADTLGYSKQIQDALAKADADLLSTWQQWLNVKYPADLKALYRDVGKEITTVKKSIPKQQKVNLKPIEAEIAALQKWKKVTVTPELKSWVSFYATWKRTYQSPVNTLVGWIKTPSKLADFLASPLIVALPAYLGKPAAARPAGAIETLLVNTWQKNPQAIYNSLLAWLVAG